MEKELADRTALDAFKIQAHAIFLDTSFNALSTVLFNLYTAFIETANKTWMYAKCLPAGKQPSTALFISKSHCEARFFVIVATGSVDRVPEERWNGKEAC